MNFEVLLDGVMYHIARLGACFPLQNIQHLYSTSAHSGEIIKLNFLNKQLEEIRKYQPVKLNKNSSKNAHIDVNLTVKNFLSSSVKNT